MALRERSRSVSFSCVCSSHGASRSAPHAACGSGPFALIRPRCDGIVPLSSLLLNWTICTLARLPICTGSVPPIELYARSSEVRLVRSPRKSTLCSEPLRLLCARRSDVTRPAKQPMPDERSSVSHVVIAVPASTMSSRYVRHGSRKPTPCHRLSVEHGSWSRLTPGVSSVTFQLSLFAQLAPSSTSYSCLSAARSSPRQCASKAPLKASIANFKKITSN